MNTSIVSGHVTGSGPKPAKPTTFFWKKGLVDRPTVVNAIKKITMPTSAKPFWLRIRKS